MHKNIMNYDGHGDYIKDGRRMSESVDFPQRGSSSSVPPVEGKISTVTHEPLAATELAGQLTFASWPAGSRRPAPAEKTVRPPGTVAVVVSDFMIRADTDGGWSRINDSLTSARPNAP